MITDPELATRALGLAEGLAASPTNLSKVSRQVGETAARWAFAQWELRKRAKAKFVRASEMWFTREALEQATHEAVAAYHAKQFPEGALVADLTTGIGADFIALARRGPAIGFELDAERADLARHNLAVHGVSAQIQVQDCFDADWPPFVFVDPARRVEGRRTARIEEFSPDPRQLAERLVDAELGIQKLTPFLTDDALAELGPKREFISYDGECREVLVYQGKQAGAGTWAVRVETGARLVESHALGSVDEPGGFVFDVDPAAVRAHAIGRLCVGGLRPLGDAAGYITGDAEIASEWYRGYRVLESGKWDLKRVRARMRDLRLSTPTLKQRGTHQDLDDLRNQLKMDGDVAAVIILYPVGKGIRYAIAQPL